MPSLGIANNLLALFGVNVTGIVIVNVLEIVMSLSCPGEDKVAHTSTGLATPSVKTPF